MADVILNQSSAQVQAFLNRMSPLIGNGGKLSALGFAYAICSTPGDIAVKQLSIPDFIRTEGALIAVHFVNAFTVSNPQLQIGSFAPADIKLYGSALAPGKVRANTVVAMRYSGGVYHVISIESQAGISSQGTVDLGLPSGVLWCEHNVGASRPEDAGLYFSWGNITGHAAGSGYNFSAENYAASAGGSLAGDIPVSDAYDMAHHNMGGLWRLPRHSEFFELFSNCTTEIIEQDGIKGIRYTSNINGNSIFFPLTGLWSGTALSYVNELACYMSSKYFTSWGGAGSGIILDGDEGAEPWPELLDPKYGGYSVRAVM